MSSYYAVASSFMLFLLKRIDEYKAFFFIYVRLICWPNHLLTTGRNGISAGRMAFSKSSIPMQKIILILGSLTKWTPSLRYNVLSNSSLRLIVILLWFYFLKYKTFNCLVTVNLSFSPIYFWRAFAEMH